MARTPKPGSVRLSERAKNVVNIIAEHHGITVTAVVEMAVRKFARGSAIPAAIKAANGEEDKQDGGQ
jgi:antitoxin component of RelBE/YafQ-DinJ toxin-antitoxin module